MKKKILIVDDEITIGMLLENFLGQEYDVTYVNNPSEALTWLESSQPDLIICDIQMPGMDGYAFLAAVRGRGFTSRTPFIMLSAKSESKERIRCYQLGAQDYVTKPFNPEELAEVIKKNLFPIHYSIVW